MMARDLYLIKDIHRRTRSCHLARPGWHFSKNQFVGSLCARHDIYVKIIALPIYKIAIDRRGSGNNFLCESQEASYDARFLYIIF